MSLLDEQVKIKWANNNRGHYENLGYTFTNYRDDLLIKSKDLTEWSNIKVNAICDICGETSNIQFSNYNKTIKKQKGRYYCNKCSKLLLAKEHIKNNKTKSFEQWCIENNKQDILDRWDYALNDCLPSEIAYASNRKFYFKCPKGIHKSEFKSINSFTSGKQKSLECSQCNMIATTHPELVKYFVNIEDAYKYSRGSHTKILMRCPECEHEKRISIPNLLRQGLGCPNCGGGGYYPEKYTYDFLTQLNIKFETQLSRNIFDWCDNFYYDFYIPSLNCIIETHGMQHYEENTNFKKSLEEEQENDRLKKEIALKNGITYYIILDCRYSRLEWIKKSICKSILPSILNFKQDDIDWKSCHKYGCSSLSRIACSLWNDGNMSIVEIAKYLGVCRNTAKTYIKQGAISGICTYNPEEETLKNNEFVSQRQFKKIICITTGKIFNSIKEASAYYQINYDGISACCNKKYHHSGKLPNGTKLVWMFYDEYIIHNENLGQAI